MKKLLVLLSVGLLALACQNVEQENGKIEMAQEALNPYFLTAGGTCDVEFTTNCDWTANVANTQHYSWASITPVSGGPGKNVITVTALPNSSVDPREFIFDIKSGGDIRRVNVIQAQKDALTAPNKNYEVPSEGGQVDVALMSNVEYSCFISAEGESWISLAETKAYEESHLVFDVAPSREFEPRSAEITITTGELTEIITITQDKFVPTLEVSDTQFSLPVSGGKVSFTVNCDIDYKVDVSRNEWAALSQDGNTITVNARQNESYAPRSVTVSIVTEHPDFFADVIVTQSGIADRLWEIALTDDLAVAAHVDQRMSLAIQDGKLLVSNTSVVVSLDAMTGEFQSQLSLPAVLPIYNVTNDNAGNLIFSEQVASGSSSTVYALSSLDATPEAVLTYDGSIYNRAGNFRVNGDIKGDAVVTAYVDVSSYWAAWEIKGGVVGEMKSGVLPVNGTIWWTGNACVYPAGTSLSDGLYFCGYTDPYGLSYCADVDANEWTMAYQTSSAGNENYPALSAAHFNGKDYVAMQMSAHFDYSDWGGYLLDVTNKSKVKVEYELHSTDFTQMNWVDMDATGDVLLHVADDGNMYMYILDASYSNITCIRFNK